MIQNAEYVIGIYRSVKYLLHQRGGGVVLVLVLVILLTGKAKLQVTHFWLVPFFSSFISFAAWLLLMSFTTSYE